MASGNTNEMKGMLKIYFCIYFCFAGSIEEVRKEGQRVPVLLGDLVESAEVDAKSKRTILFQSEQNRGTMGRSRRGDKSVSKVFIKEFPKCFQLFWGQWVETSKWGFGVMLDVNL